MTRANMVLNRLEPMTELMSIARIREGKDRTISEKRIMTLSTLPPTYPAMAPYREPRAPAMMTVRQPASREYRPP